MRIMLAVLAMLSVAAPACARAERPWCAAIPLTAGASCRPLEVKTPRATIRLAVAAREVAREHGLMNVAMVPEREGMIFVFAGPDALKGFWMKNTIAPLDMIFVRRDGVVSSVEADVPATKPGTSDADVARRDGVGSYVIELGAGDAARVGIVPGVRLSIPRIPAE